MSVRNDLNINLLNRADRFLERAEATLKDSKTASLVDRVSSAAGIIVGAVVLAEMAPLNDLTVSYNGASHTFSNDTLGGSIIVLSCLGGASNAFRNLGAGLSSMTLGAVKGSRYAISFFDKVASQCLSNLANETAQTSDCSTVV